MFQVGDFVFAHIRGHPPWPAVINEIETVGKVTLFNVSFYGPEKGTGQCTKNKLYLYEEKKSILCKGKIMDNKDFVQSIKEIELEIKTKKSRKSSCNSPLSCSLLSSTPINSKLNKKTTKPSDKAVNTPSHLDLDVQLEALTKKCIELEKMRLENEEKLVSLKKRENGFKSEIEQLKNKNAELENKLKLLAEKPQDNDNNPPEAQKDFQTQIILKLLKDKKLENYNLEQISKLLQDELNSLEQQQNIKLSTGKCINCFPPLNISKCSLNSSVSTSAWSQVTKPNKKANRPKSPLQLGVSTSNSFAPLAVSDEMMEEGESNMENDPKILICADSHGRDLAFHLNKTLKSNSAFSFVNPGGRTKEIVNSGNIEAEKLKSNDVLVLMCGSNDISRNEATEALEEIQNTVKKNLSTKIVLVDLPTRYDLTKWSCVNKEVRKTNKSLQQISKQYSNVAFVEASKAERRLHTRQGSHLNYMGKVWLAKSIAEAINMKNTKQALEAAAAGTKKSPEQGLVLGQPPPPGVETSSENSKTTSTDCQP